MNYNVKKNIYDIKVLVRTKDKRFFFIVKNALHFFSDIDEICSNFDLEVDFISYNKYSMQTKKTFSAIGMKKLGQSLYITENELYWDDKDFQVRVVAQDGRLNVQSTYFERLDRSVRNALFFKRGIRDSLYQNVLRTIIYHPLFYLLEIKQNKFLIHASLIEKDGQSICLIGYNGAGKSSLAYYMSKNFGYSLLSDNYCLYDGTYIYSFPETIRITKESYSKMDLNEEQSASIFMTNGKMNLLDETISSKTKPVALIFCSLGASANATIRNISSERLVRITTNMHDYIKEFHNYSYMAPYDYLEYSKTDIITSKERLERLIEISSSTACFELVNNNVNDYACTAREIIHAVFNK